jgi:hypothetical protein
MKFWVFMVLIGAKSILAGQPGPPRVTSQHVIPELLKTSSETFVKGYEDLINLLGSPTLHVSAKEQLIEKSSDKLWYSKAVQVADDLYLPMDGQQFFDGNAYLHTVAAWYATGVQVKFLDVEIVEMAWQPTYLMVEVTWKRVLTGQDFLGTNQMDTACVQGVLAYPLRHANEGILVDRPLFMAIYGVQASSPPSTTVLTQMKNETTTSTARPIQVDTPASIDSIATAKVAPFTTDDRTAHLAAALSQYQNLKRASSPAQARKRVDWRPW